MAACPPHHSTETTLATPPGTRPETVASLVNCSSATTTLPHWPSGPCARQARIKRKPLKISAQTPKASAYSATGSRLNQCPKRVAALAGRHHWRLFSAGDPPHQAVTLLLLRDACGPAWVSRGIDLPEASNHTSPMRTGNANQTHSYVNNEKSTTTSEASIRSNPVSLLPSDCCHRARALGDQRCPLGFVLSLVSASICRRKTLAT